MIYASLGLNELNRCSIPCATWLTEPSIHRFQKAIELRWHYDTDICTMTLIFALWHWYLHYDTDICTMTLIFGTMTLILIRVPSQRLINLNIYAMNMYSHFVSGCTISIAATRSSLEHTDNINPALVINVIWNLATIRNFFQSCSRSELRTSLLDL